MKKCLKCGWYLYEDPSNDYDEDIENRYEYKDYICRDCLLGKNKNQSENCSQHQWLEGFLDIEGNLVLYECSECHYLHEIRCIEYDI